MKNANPTRTIVKRNAAPAAKKGVPAKKAPVQAGRAVARNREEDTGGEWHKATEKPGRANAVYQVQTSAGIMYRLWDGKHWHRGASNPRDAEDKAWKQDGSPSLAANKLPWRGAARPKARGNR